MPTLELDTIDSDVNLEGNATIQVNRGFIAYGLDTSVDRHELMGNVLDLEGMPDMGSAYPSTRFGAALLSRIQIVAIDGNKLRGQLVYSTIQGATPTAYVLTRSSRLVQETATHLPDGTLIAVGFKDQATGKTQVPIDLVPTTFLRPCTTLVAEGLRYGEPNYTAANYTGFVNSVTWGDRPKGHWLIAEFTTTWSKYSGYHTFRCVVQAFMDGKDWSNTVVLKSSISGKFAISSATEGQIKDCLTKPYSYGIIGPDRPEASGFARVGGYPLINFAEVGL